MGVVNIKLIIFYNKSPFLHRNLWISPLKSTLREVDSLEIVILHVVSYFFNYVSILKIFVLILKFEKLLNTAK